MAVLYVKSGGSNTAPYDTWAKAATSLQTALTAMAAGDVVVLKYNGVPSGDAELASSTTFTFNDSGSLICASEDGATAFTPTAMGTSFWIGSSTLSPAITLSAGGKQIYIYGLTFRKEGSASNNSLLSGSGGTSFIMQDCTFWESSTGSTARFTFGTLDTPTFVRLINPTFRPGSSGAAHKYTFPCKAEIFGGSIDNTEATPSAFCAIAGQDPGGGVLFVEGMDLTNLGSNTLIQASTTIAGLAVFSRCKLGSGITVLATQTPPGRAGCEVYLFDCATGDSHVRLEYHNALGSLLTETGIYFTASEAAQSWKITTTASASPLNPFETPWVDLYHTGTSAITPYFEILRDGSTTAFTDAQVWGEFSVKSNAGVVTPSFASDRQSLASFAAGTAASNQANGAGLGSWTGEAGSAWSGKVDSGSSVTPAEAGHIRGRVAVGEPSITVYVDPVIRT